MKPRTTTFSAEQGVGNGHRNGRKALDAPFIGSVAEGRVVDVFGSSCRDCDDQLLAERSMEVSVRLEQLKCQKLETFRNAERMHALSTR